MLPSVCVNLLKDVAKFSKFSAKFISTNSTKRTTEALNVSKKDDFKNLGESTETGDTSSKPLGWDDALPFEALPGPKPLPIIGNVWRFLPYIGEYYNLYPKDLYKLLKDQYGNILILGGIFGRKPLIMLFDVDDMEKALRNEGPFPFRTVTESVVYYRTKVRNDIFKDAGVGGLQGEEWFKVRSKVNPILMQPRTAQQYVGKMDEVAGELVENIRYFSKINENKEMPDDFQNELYKWALESIGVIALDKHLGCLDLNAPKGSEPQRLISNVNEMFLLMYKLDFFLPPIWKYIETPTWRRFVKVADFITEIVVKYTEEAMNKDVGENVPENQLSVIQRLAKQEKSVAVVTAMDMLVAGIDTTGKTLATTLYFLARNPDKQRILREEVLRNLPEKDSPVTKEILSKSPYLKAVIKESTRIAPIAVANMRTSVKDMVLAGYRIPKGSNTMTMHMISANSDNMFKDPDKFVPERWLRSTEDEYSHKNVHPFAFMPFGFGPRSCIGKRFANLELEVVLAKIIRNLELSWHHEDMIFSGTLLYGIARPLKLRVKEI